jgi:hypothetical protein
MNTSTAISLVALVAASAVAQPVKGVGAKLGFALKKTMPIAWDCTSRFFDAFPIRPGPTTLSSASRR